MGFTQSKSMESALVAIADEIARTVAGPRAAVEDAEARWPAETMRALGEAGLLGLHVPTELGGHGQGLHALAVISEVLGRESSSAAMCFAMHCVGTAVIAVKASPEQRVRYLEPIARGEHVTTIALSEPGTGSHFYYPQTRVARRSDSYVVNGTKSFVTNGGHADSYVVSVVASAEGAAAEEGAFSFLIVDADRPGMAWDAPWNGFGLRGNSSRSVHLENVAVPAGNLVGAEGDHMWYVFEVVAPYFLTGMAGTYLGIAQAAFDVAAHHLVTRRHTHTGEVLGSQPILAGRLGLMWRRIEEVRQLLASATARADAGDPDSLPAVLSCKAAAADVAVQVTSDALTLCGGIEYRENGRLTRLMRDAHASHIMGPTTDLLNVWVGRAVLGLPILE